jgi:hypothetical protein
MQSNVKNFFDKFAVCQSFRFFTFVFVCFTGSLLGQQAPAPTGCSCKSEGGYDDKASTPISAEVAKDVREQVESKFKGLAVDVASIMKHVDEEFKLYENKYKGQSGWDLLKFNEAKSKILAEVRAEIAKASTELASKITGTGEKLGKDLQDSINKASPDLVGLGQYEHCLDPCEYQNGNPGWSPVGKLGIDGLRSFEASATLSLGPIEISASAKIPGFADLTISGLTLSASFTASIKGQLTPDEPSSIKPKNKPVGKASALVDFPLTGSARVTNKTMLIGGEGELELTINKRIGPVELNYEAEDTCNTSH